MAQPSYANTHGAERGLSRFEGFSDAVFATALPLRIVAIKVPGSPDGPQGYTDLARARAEQWRETLALVLCYIVIGGYWLQPHYSGRIYAKIHDGYEIFKHEQDDCIKVVLKPHNGASLSPRSA